MAFTIPSLIPTYAYPVVFVSKYVIQTKKIKTGWWIVSIRSAIGHTQRMVPHCKTAHRGGVASVLSSHAIQQGWHVVGTMYSAEENRAVSICTDNKANVFRMSGSKYIPAYTEEAVRASLKVPGNVLFIGTPCMVYSMRRLVERIGAADRFYFVDFVCHGVPSLKIWRKHIEEMAKKYGSEIENVRFRSKHFGWHNITMEYTLKAAGTQIYSSRKSDSFMRLFDASFLSNESCFECPMNNQYSAADIRLGDYWGAKFSANQDGVSRCAILSDKGNELWKQVQPMLQYEEDEGISYRKDNRYYLLVRRNSALKRKVLESVGTLGCKRIYRLYRKSLPMKRRVYDALPRFLKQLYLRLKGGTKE